ncbi:hypothetical protein ACN47E_002015 [Coniothyrium glycines]
MSTVSLPFWQLWPKTSTALQEPALRPLPLVSPRSTCAVVETSDGTAAPWLTGPAEAPSIGISAFELCSPKLLQSLRPPPPTSLHPSLHPSPPPYTAHRIAPSPRLRQNRCDSSQHHQHNYLPT